MANSFPVSRCEQIASAPAPAPQPISRTWSPGWTSIRSTAHLMRGGMVEEGMAHSLPDRVHESATATRDIGRAARLGA